MNESHEHEHRPGVRRVTGEAILYALFGATLVALGVLVGAWANRVSNRPRRYRDVRATSVIPMRTARGIPIRVVTPKAPGIAPKMETKTDTMTNDVITALMAAGYKKQIATEAALGCGQAERATIEHWTRAALRRCAKGSAS